MVEQLEASMERGLDGNEAASRRIGVTDFRYGSNTCNSWRLSSRMVCASKNVESIFSPPIRDSLLSNYTAASLLVRLSYEKERGKKERKKKEKKRKSSLVGWSLE